MSEQTVTPIIAEEQQPVLQLDLAYAPMPDETLIRTGIPAYERLGYRVAKRVMDLVISVLALVLLSPLLLVVAILVKLEEPSVGVFFKQVRAGLNGSSFLLYKFRSMRPNADKERNSLLAQNEMDGPVFKIKEDPRITKIGKFLRRSSIDELPQLFNVLRGHMSLVGPRPLFIDEALQNPYQSRRDVVKPGITCIWQVSGRNNLTFEQWMEMDLEYVNKQSIGFDFYLLFKTIPAVCTIKGAS